MTRLHGDSARRVKLTRAQRAKLQSLNDDWREEDDDWRAGVVFLRLMEDMGLCEMEERRLSGGDVTTGPGSWGHRRWFTRRTEAGRRALSQQPPSRTGDT